MTSTSRVLGVGDVVEILRGYRFTHARERDLQHGVEDALTRAGLAVRSEVQLGPRCRIDVLVDRIGIEIKVAGGWRGVARQLERYAERDEIDGLVLVTAQAGHARMPLTILDKPVAVHRAGSSL